MTETAGVAEKSASVPARGLRRFRWLAELEVEAAALALWAALRLLGFTLRYELHGNPELSRRWRSGSPVLMAFWHGRAVAMPLFYGGRGAFIMNSAHRDGRIVTGALARFGIGSTSGSSTRGGVGGLLGLVRAHRRGRDVALIPDGPRGPAGVAKAGAVELMLATRTPLFPLATSCTRGWRLPTWDRLLVPRPFSTVVLEIGEPLEPASFADAGSHEERRERCRGELERRLKDVTEAADRRSGRRPIEAT